MKTYLTYIIDESPETSTMLSKKLKKIPGMDVGVFETPVAAIGSLNKKPDFVVMDYFMKSKNKIDVIPLFREFAPEARILVLVNQEKLATRENCFSFPGDEYFIKDGTESILVLGSIWQCIKKKCVKDSNWTDRFSAPLNLKKKQKQVFFFSTSPPETCQKEHDPNYTIRVFSDYFDFENHYAAAKPDLAIIDFDGPDMLISLSLLKQLRTDSCKMPVIIMSQKKDLAKALKAISDGASYYLVKRKNYLNRLNGILEMMR